MDMMYFHKFQSMYHFRFDSLPPVMSTKCKRVYRWIPFGIRWNPWRDLHIHNKRINQW